MAKIVKVTSGGSNSYAGDSADYKIVVDSGGKIVFNTGNQVGDVVITGSLTVLGTLTSLETTNTTITDNIIVLNQDESGAGVTLGTSGIEIDRGTLNNNAQWVYDESIDAWSAKYKTSGAYIPVATNYIYTSGGDLTLIGSGTGVLTVTGTVDYETHVTSDDHIPNYKKVQDYVAYYTAAFPPKQIVDYDTRVTVADATTTGFPSNIAFLVNNVTKMTLDATGAQIGNITFNNNDITNPTTDLISFQSYLSIPNKVATPSTPSTSVKLYSKNTPGNGGTGLFFVNTQGTNDELISRTKALLFALIL
jgi:hypothetical protein